MDDADEVKNSKRAVVVGPEVAEAIAEATDRSMGEMRQDPGIEVRGSSDRYP